MKENKIIKVKKEDVRILSYLEKNKEHYCFRIIDEKSLQDFRLKNKPFPLVYLNSKGMSETKKKKLDDFDGMGQSFMVMLEIRNGEKYTYAYTQAIIQNINWLSKLTNISGMSNIRPRIAIDMIIANSISELHNKELELEIDDNKEIPEIMSYRIVGESLTEELDNWEDVELEEMVFPEF